MTKEKTTDENRYQNQDKKKYKSKTRAQSMKGHTNSIVHGGRMNLAKRKIDGRSTLGKWLRDVKQAIVTDLGGDVTTSQMLLIERAVFKVTQIKFFEQAFVRGETQDFHTYLSLTNSLRNDLQALGLQRREKDYLSYLDEKHGQKDIH